MLLKSNGSVESNCPRRWAVAIGGGLTALAIAFAGFYLPARSADAAEPQRKEAEEKPAPKPAPRPDTLKDTIDKLLKDAGDDPEARKQIEELLKQGEISLAVPIQSRVKKWDSLQAKLERKQRLVTSITELSDLVGLRIIVLFFRDLDRVCNVLEERFRILERFGAFIRPREAEAGTCTAERRRILQQRGLTADQLDRAGRALASDPGRAANLFDAIQKRAVNTVGAVPKPDPAGHAPPR